MKKKELRHRLDLALNRLSNKERRKRTYTEYFMRHGEYLIPWLKKLAEECKTQEMYPVSALTLLPHYYTDSRDREIAAFITLLVRGEGGMSEVSALREMFGDSPWAWFRRRAFVPMSIGDSHIETTGGISNWRIAKFLDCLWDTTCTLWGAETQRTPIFTALKRLAEEWNCSVYEVTITLFKEFRISELKVNTLFLVLGSSDGIGLGLWDIQPTELRCPVTRGVKGLFETVWPDYKKVGHIEECIPLLGLDAGSDLYYAALAYERLVREKPKECGRFIHRYTKIYLNGIERPHRPLETELPMF